MVIAGNDSTIEGSLFLGGESTGSGIQFGGVGSTLPETGEDGATGSGFIRSLGYRGFTSASLDPSNTGFMIYSGSVLPNSGDSYGGVGLELVGLSGSLRFSTIPSRFEVEADAFFVSRLQREHHKTHHWRMQRGSRQGSRKIYLVTSQHLNRRMCHKVCQQMTIRQKEILR